MRLGVFSENPQILADAKELSNIHGVMITITNAIATH